jgi:hypothetical protein
VRDNSRKSGRVCAHNERRPSIQIDISGGCCWLHSRDRPDRVCWCRLTRVNTYSIWLDVGGGDRRPKMRGYSRSRVPSVKPSRPPSMPHESCLRCQGANEVVRTRTVQLRTWRPHGEVYESQTLRSNCRLAESAGAGPSKLVFLTRTGCVKTDTMRARLDDALRSMGSTLKYEVVDLDSLPTPILGEDIRHQRGPEAARPVRRASGSPRRRLFMANC